MRKGGEKGKSKTGNFRFQFSCAPLGTKNIPETLNKVMYCELWNRVSRSVDES